ncbi:hypothetical protein ACFSKN_14635 [Mariniflexile gromovii]|uniref:Uncharacterized protein n=1 Tax=Mariniflexile gromovii TaxID=362523 RepID=A0ABS4BT79_9FLAO|nr:hypothetical protein [Mariniflexile gromovii]MBP0903206.1 hypothetical protein [Mariniflexile gromovii]
MGKLFLILWISMFSATIQAQKIINNPDYINTNINGSVTKVELTDSETILHFHIKVRMGSWFSVPNQTYIESSVDGKRLFVVKADGTTLHRKHHMTDSDEVRFKLYFPPLPKDVETINYGESNKDGNWFIYKLDVTKDGKRFLNTSNTNNLNPWKISIGSSNPAASSKDRVVEMLDYKRANYVSIGGESILAKDLPSNFFGSWYDKYDTLILIATPDYIVSDYRVQYYQDIKKIGENKFFIKSANRGFEILSLDKETMTIRTERLSTLKRKPSSNQVPKFLKGNWLHWDNKKEIKVTDDYFYNNDHGDLGVYEVKYRIDQVVESESGNVIWFVLYNQGDYYLYSARKSEGEYVLQPRGFANARYKKVKN